MQANNRRTTEGEIEWWVDEPSMDIASILMTIYRNDIIHQQLLIRWADRILGVHYSIHKNSETHTSKNIIFELIPCHGWIHICQYHHHLLIPILLPLNNEMNTTQKPFPGLFEYHPKGYAQFFWTHYSRLCLKVHRRTLPFPISFHS